MGLNEFVLLKGCLFPRPMPTEMCPTNYDCRETKQIKDLTVLVAVIHCTRGHTWNLFSLLLSQLGHRWLFSFAVVVHSCCLSCPVEHPFMFHRDCKCLFSRFVLFKE